MEVECLACKRPFTIQRTGSLQATLSARQPQYGQPQPAQQPYGQPQFGQPQPQQPYGQPPVNYGGAFQSIGAQFQLMPGEFLIHQEQMQVAVIPAKTTTMRLTNQRLVFCDISRALTIGVSWLFCFMNAATISHSFSRAEIVEMHLEKMFFGRQKVVITNIRGETLPICGTGFNNNAVNLIMQWYHSPAGA